MVAIAALSVVGCGYRFVGYAGAREAGRSVAVRTLGNESSEPGVEMMVSDALRRQVLRRGALRLVRDADDADFVVTGSVLPILTTARSFSSVVLALEYTVTLALQLDIAKSDGSRRALDPSSLRESEIYLASADVEIGRKNREEALRRLSVLLASRVHDVLDEELLP